MTTYRSKILADYITSHKTIVIDEDFMREIEQLNPHLAQEFATTGRIGRNDHTKSIGDLGVNFKKTPRESSRDGKKPKPQDLREDFINNWGGVEPELEVYNRDPIPLSTYRSMSFDPKLKLATELICGFIAKLQFEIVSSDPKKAAIVKSLMVPIYSQLVRDMSKYGIQNGYMVGEKVWERRSIKIYDESTKELMHSGRVLALKKVKALDPDNRLRFWIDAGTDELVRIEQEQTRGKVVAPRKKIFWFALDKEYSNIFGTSKYRSAYQSWYYGNGLEQALLMKLDTTGEPILVVKFPPGKNMMNGQMVDNDVIAELLAQEVQSEKVIKIPSQVDVNGEPLWDIYYVELKNSENDPYLKALEFFDKKKVESVGLFGNMIVGDGNFSEIDAKETMSLVMIESMVFQIEDCIQEEIIDWITSYNFGPKWIDDVKIRIDRNSLGRSKALMEVLKEMLRIAAAEKTGRPDVMPSIERISNILSIPTEKWSDQIDRSLLDDQMKAEKAMQPKPAPAAPGAKPAKPKAEGESPVAKKVADEDSNDKNRKTPDTRDRGRPSANKDK